MPASRSPRIITPRHLARPAWATDSSDGCLAIAKLPTEAGNAAVIAAGEGRRRVIVPVSIERNVQGEIALEFYAIRGVEIEMDRAGFRDGRQKKCVDSQIGFVQTRKPDFSPNRR